MSEMYGAAAFDQEENRARMARLTVGTLGRVVIACDGALEHYDETGREFRAAKWNDPNPNEMGKFYTLQQFTQPAGSFSYSLKVFCNSSTPIEWYDFHDGLAYVRNRLQTHSKKLTLEQHSADYARATGYLVTTLAERGYKAPLAALPAPSAPADRAGRAPDFSLAENQVFLDLAATLNSENL
ncbi:hypothetical protein EYC59_06510 [Candidatus Saccharibacteria bacterium]|nr:MAG: hypothetical protein EYC59_06510 [Candidatus Saccharibacteria bacterium]